jgi:YHS domain-containing protein
MDDRCTICGASLEPDHGAPVMVLEGATFHFCSLECLKIFKAFPEAYIHEEETELRSVEDTRP